MLTTSRTSPVHLRPVPGLDLDLAGLGAVGATLGAGGEGRVFALDGLGLPDAPGPLVFKRYTTARPLRPALTALIEARTALNEAGRRRLDATTTWPIRRVVEHGAVVGLVMPRIPGPYLIDLVLPGTGRSTRIPHDLQTLMIGADRALALGRPWASGETRLRVARDVASAIAFLHDEMAVVLGDVSPRNTLIRLDETPYAILVDCDGMRTTRDAATTRAVHTPDWDPPEAWPPRHGGSPTRAGDLYKFGLLVLRILAPRPEASIDRDARHAAGHLSPTGQAMLADALGHDPARRPSAIDWFVQLSRELGEPVRPPQLLDADAEPSLVVPGATTRVRWSASDPCRIEVHADGVLVGAQDAPSGAGSLDVTPRRSGVLTVVATNQIGEDRRTTRPVFVLEPPGTVKLPVPMPPLELPAVSARALPPLDPTPLPELPLLTLPTELVDLLAAPRAPITDVVLGPIFPPVPDVDPSSATPDPLSALVPTLEGTVR